MKSKILKKSALLLLVCALFGAHIVYAEDLSVEPDVVNLGEPKYQPESQAAQEIHDAIAKTKHDIDELNTNTANEIAAIHNEINLLKTTPGNAEQIQALKDRINTLKQNNQREIKGLQKQIKQLERAAHHKFHVRHERY